MVDITNARDIEGMFESVYIEVMTTLERCRPGERVTIFLSTRLYLYLNDVHMQKIQHAMDPSSNIPRITLFGCKVEVYDDSDFSFYVTTARKHKF